MSEELQFQAEVSQLLDIVANALYSEREVFLRELISNASDACDRLRYQSLTQPELLGKDSDLKIRLVIDTDARTLKIIDNGIGMSKDELIQNLGTIAHSGTGKILEELAKNKDADKKDTMNLIGQFGVGFYSAFMVSDSIEVLSRKANEDTAWLWSSNGKGGYTVDEDIKDNRGTEITLHLKDDAGEYLLEERIKHVVKTYSDHIAFPIIFGAEKDAEAINSASALWMKPKADITEKEYTDFYRHVNEGMNFDVPFKTFHWRAEGAIEYTNLLFIPGMKPFDLYDPKRHHGVKLYVRRVFITEGVEGLVPPFLRFMKGVVDSEDLPLNISREMLQHNPVVSKISNTITKRILTDLQKCAEEEPEKFADFWSLFGPVLKEGLYDAHQYRDKLNKVVRFYSSKGDALVSFDEYFDRMKEGQEHIYYMSGPDIDTLRNSPQLEGFKARDIEVLFMTDTIDDYWLPIANDYREKTFQSITKGAIDLSVFDDDKKTDEKSSEDKSESLDEEQEKDPVLVKIKEALGDEVNDVCYSKRLTESPVCLVAQESGMDMHMERLLKSQQGYEELGKRVLEVNENHPIVQKLKAFVSNDGEAEIINDTAWLLLDQARIIEGDPLPNPTAFARRMVKVMEQGLLAEEKAS